MATFELLTNVDISSLRTPGPAYPWLSEVSISRWKTGEVVIYLRESVLKQAGFAPTDPLYIVPDNVGRAFQQLRENGSMTALDQTPTALFITRCRSEYIQNRATWNGKRLALCWQAYGRTFDDGEFLLYWYPGYPKKPTAQARFPQQSIKPSGFVVKEGLIMIGVPSGLFANV